MSRHDWRLGTAGESALVGPGEEELCEVSDGCLVAGRENDMGTGWCGVRVPLGLLVQLLQRHGFTLIGPEDAAVLEAGKRINQRWLESYVRIISPKQADPDVFAWAQAELARRAAKETPRG